MTGIGITWEILEIVESQTLPKIRWLEEDPHACQSVRHTHLLDREFLDHKDVVFSLPPPLSQCLLIGVPAINRC